MELLFAALHLFQLQRSIAMTPLRQRMLEDMLVCPLAEISPDLGHSRYRALPCCLALSIKRRHLGYVHFAAQWLAYVYPCQRFTSHLTVRRA
jgi:hypothetical protein